MVLMDAVQYGPTLFGIGCLVWAILTESKYRKLRELTVHTCSNVADGLAFIYDRAQTGKLCDEDTLTQMAVRAGDMWSDLAVLGPAVRSVLKEKSNLAETLKKV